jgi:hypothetical protein
MRAVAPAWVLVSAAAVACGGRVEHASSVASVDSGVVTGVDSGVVTGVDSGAVTVDGGVVTVDGGVVMPACPPSPTLTLTSSALIVPAAAVPMPPPSAGGGVFLTSIAAAPSGEFFVTWSANIPPGKAGGTNEGFAVVAQPGSMGTSVAPIVSVPAGGQAAFDGSAFAVVGTSTVSTATGASSGPYELLLQRVDVAGQLAGPQVSIEELDSVNTFVSSVVSTPRGLAIGWYGSSAEAMLVGADGSIEQEMGMAPFPGGEGETNGPVGLAVAQGQLVAAYGDSLLTLDWLGGSSATTQTPFVMAPGRTGGGRSGSLVFFAGSDQVTMWGRPDSLTADGGQPVGLYVGAVGGPFTQIASVDPVATLVQQSNGCGGIGTLSQTGTSLSVSWGSPPATVGLGSDWSLFSLFAAMVPTAAGFGVAWIDTDGIHLATLVWE